jgi:hypothetical protein
MTDSAFLLQQTRGVTMAFIAERCLKVAGGFNPRTSPRAGSRRGATFAGSTRRSATHPVFAENRGLKPPATFKHRSAMGAKRGPRLCVSMKYEKSPLYKAAHGVVETMTTLEALASLGALAAVIAWLHHIFYA